MVHLGPQAAQVKGVLPAHQVLEVSKVCQERRASLAPTARTGRQACRVLGVCQAAWVSVVSEDSQENAELRVLRESPENVASQDCPELTVQQVLQDLRDRRVILDHLVLWVFPEDVDPLAFQVRRVNEAPLVQLDPKALQDGRVTRVLRV